MKFSAGTSTTALASLLVSFIPVNAAAFARVDLKSMLTDVSNKWTSKTTLSFPGQPQFVNATQRWTLFDEPTYFAAISPGSEQDLVTVVKLATSHGVPFLATGARHGYTTTLGNLQNGLSIDLSQFSSYSIDSAAATLTVGGSVTINQVKDAIYAAGFMIPSGSCSCPGFVGVTLGAGIGRYQGVFGLLIDSLVSVRLVTADGRLITVSATSNPDLFWAIRGAGSNFGIITSATYKLHPQINGGQLTNVDFAFPANQSSAFFKALASYNGTMPKELATNSLIIYDATAKAPQIISNWVYFGTEANARTAMARLFALNPPVAVVTEIPWNQVYATQGFGMFDAQVCAKNVIRDLYATNVRNLSAPTMDLAFQRMTTFFVNNPNALDSSVQFEIFPNQATIAVSCEDTAYPWRDTLGYVSQSYSGWAAGDAKTVAAVEANAKLIRSDFAATSGYPELRVYQNYAHGDEKLEQIYGAKKLPRLAGLKKIWDPSNVFKYNNALPTSYP